jgi:hypothetical protein
MAQIIFHTGDFHSDDQHFSSSVSRVIPNPLGWNERHHGVLLTDPNDYSGNSQIIKLAMLDSKVTRRRSLTLAQCKHLLLCGMPMYKTRVEQRIQLDSQSGTWPNSPDDQTKVGCVEAFRRW